MAKIKIRADFRNHPYLSVKLTKAKRMKKKLPKPLPWIEGSLNISYLEIAEALIFGLNHAVIALCGGFSEHLFRLCLYERKKGCQKGKTVDKEFWETLNKMGLTKLLEDAKEIIPIPKTERGWWFDFSKTIRNAYVHFKLFDILEGKVRLVCDASTGEEFEISVQSHKNEWAAAKKSEDEMIALSLFSELRKRTLRIFDAMNWVGREPEGETDCLLCKQYHKFFSEDFNSYIPKFIGIPDDYWVDY